MFGAVVIVLFAALIANVMFRLQLFGLQGFIPCLSACLPLGGNLGAGQYSFDVSRRRKWACRIGLEQTVALADLLGCVARPKVK